MSANKQYELEDLARLWHEDAGPSVAGLKPKVRRAVMLNRLTLVAEVAVAVAGATAGIWLIVTGQWLVGGAACVFSIFGLIMSVSTRWRASHFDTETLLVAAQSALAQTNVEYRRLLGGIWVCAAALIFIAIIGWDAMTRIPSSPTELLGLIRAVTAATLAIGIALGFVAIRLRSVQKRATTLRDLQQTTGDD